MTLCFSRHILLQTTDEKETKKYTHLLKETSRILADLGKAWYDVVEVEVAESGMVTTLALHLSQQQVPAVHRRQHILLLPKR